MFEIQICGLSEINKHLPWATHMISLVDSKNHIPAANIPQHVEIFGDITPKDAKFFNVPLANNNQINNILSFVKTMPKDAKLLVHCHAGVGRSTATAIAILCFLGFPTIKAIETIERIRPQMWPNEWVIELWAKKLNLPELIVEVEAWKNQASKTLVLS